MSIKRAWVITKSEVGINSGEDSSRRVVMLAPKSKGWRYAVNQLIDLDRLLNPSGTQGKLQGDHVHKRDFYIISLPFCVRAQLSTIVRGGDGQNGELLDWQPDGYPRVVMNFKEGEAKLLRHEFPVTRGWWDRTGTHK